MSRHQPPRLPRIILAELEGLDWELVLGSRHWLLKIDGILVAIWPRGPLTEGGNRNTLGVRASIRKYKANRSSLT